ncbi:spore cortex-lytic enzyme [Paenibacillus psychroresistens]|uniref:Spore cortex-lytic enzyme n=1 Tax=Paenibacillus psychroresistens TaxID=1778678 RepID=A0A6B8RJ55_9BACL|nr:spore cortex-lytic enzyme [Paenibacillus psychroresistens]QGQ96290.1 spore cortex-lytic enzyme [Paenibacillus psychroresistens]
MLTANSKLERLSEVKKNQKNRLVVFTVLLVVVLYGGYQFKHAKIAHDAQETFSNSAVHYGAKGEDVFELQGRLKHLGFFKGSVDGQYGFQTLKAVKYFQSEFGMKVDGIVGAKTKLKLWQATKNWAPTADWKQNKPVAGNPSNAPKDDTASLTPSSMAGMTANDLRMMANAVYGESRGEPYIGQVAVAAVILNRVRNASFPNTIYGVIYQPGAFTAVADGQINLTPNETAKKAVNDAIGGIDPTNGCIYYFNPETATSKWIWTRKQVKTIGKHIFAI